MAKLYLCRVCKSPLRALENIACGYFCKECNIKWHICPTGTQKKIKDGFECFHSDSRTVKV
jgi:hypothetical protein